MLKTSRSAMCLARERAMRKHAHNFAQFTFSAVAKLECLLHTAAADDDDRGGPTAFAVASSHHRTTTRSTANKSHHYDNDNDDARLRIIVRERSSLACQRAPLYTYTATPLSGNADSVKRHDDNDDNASCALRLHT